MGRRDWDRFMVATKIGGNWKLLRLTPAERWCYVAGVLAIAAEAPVRGAMILTEAHPATDVDVARAAGVTRAVAASALNKLRELHMLVPDGESHWEFVRDWDEWNPAPKPSDSPESRRERKQRQRDRERDTRDSHADVTRDPSREVKEEVKPPISPEGFEEWLEDHATVTGRQAPKLGTKARATLVSSFKARLDEGYTLPELKMATRGAHANDHRRENGYDGAENVLRPQKVHDLIENGRRLRPVTERPDDTEQRLREAEL